MDVNPSGRLVAATFAGYLIGSLPVADRVARRYGIDDLRAVGDGNPGFWNAREQIGTRPALPILVGDLAKGVGAAAIGQAADRRWWVPYLTGGAAMVGHAFPAGSPTARRGRGGRSVLAFVGTATVAAPCPAAASWLTLAAAWALTRRFERSVHVAVTAFPIWQLALEGRRRTALTGVLMTFVGWRFRRLDRHR